jgi:hypothetical protein
MGDEEDGWDGNRWVVGFFLELVCLFHHFKYPIFFFFLKPCLYINTG